MRPRRDRRVRTRRLNISLPPNRPLRNGANGARWLMSFRAATTQRVIPSAGPRLLCTCPLSSTAPTIPDAWGPVHPASMRSSGRWAYSPRNLGSILQIGDYDKFFGKLTNVLSDTSTSFQAKSLKARLVAAFSTYPPYCHRRRRRERPSYLPESPPPALRWSASMTRSSRRSAGQCARPWLGRSRPP